MGQYFTQPNTALSMPGGPAMAVGNPQQLAQAASSALPSADAMLGPDVLKPNQNAPELPFIRRPSVMEAEQAGARPGSGQGNVFSPGLSKGGKLLTLLTSGLQGALAGRAAQEQAAVQSGGRRAGGVGLGFEAGYAQPFQRQEQEAQAQLAQAGVQPVATPYGNLPAALAPKLLTPYLNYEKGVDVQNLRGQSAQTVQGMKGQSAENVQQLRNQGKLSAIQLQTEIVKQKGTKFLPDVDANGQRFYHVLNPYGQEIGQADVNVIPSLMTRTSNSVEWKEADDGSFHALPKTTVSGPNLGSVPSAPARGAVGAGATINQIPGGGQFRPIGTPARRAQTLAAPSANNSSAGGGGSGVPGFRGKNSMNMVIGTEPPPPGSPPGTLGKQVSGTPQELKDAGINNFVKAGESIVTQVNTARQLTAPGGLFDLVSKDLDKFKPGELGPLNSRWQEFLAGTYGGDSDPRYVRLRTHLNGLLGTAMMQAHVGQRGGEAMMEHFENIAQAGKMDAATIKEAINAEKDYVNEKAMRPTPRQQQAPANGAATHRYNPNTGRIEALQANP